jgi:uncharacterized RDD family membrane protein YckC
MIRESVMPASGNPFPGLRPFLEEEEYLFFGRESQIDRIVDKLSVTRFLAVVGTSGSGKSSLVNCGLRPAVRRGLLAGAGTSWRIVQFRPGADPLDSLARALAQDPLLFPAGVTGGMPVEQLVSATLRMSNLGLSDLYEQMRLPAGTNLLVIVDQFEELFRYRGVGRPGAQASDASSETPAAFVNLLLSAHAQPQHPIYVVLTMRSDFLGDCAQFCGLPEAINEGQYLVPRLTRDERRAAIMGPVGVVGAEISPVLLTRLVNDTGDNPDQLSILQHALNRTWAWWQNEGGGVGPLSIDAYEAIGTMAHALDRHAEKAFQELDTDRERLVCAKVFKALTDMGTDSRGTRRPTSLARLCGITGASQAEIESVISVFRKPSRSFLMPPITEPLTPDTVIDISHESLMRVWKRLRDWAEQEAESARMYRRIRDTAALHASGKAGLWRDPDLQFALDWRSREEPTEDWANLYGCNLPAALSFVDQSKWMADRAAAEIELRRHWNRWCLVPGAVLLLAPYVVLLNALRDRGVFNFLPFYLGVIAESTFPAVPVILAGLALNYLGKRAHRTLMFPRILTQVPELVARRQASVDRHVDAVTGERKPTAAEVLGTNYAGFWLRAAGYAIDFAVGVSVVFGVTVLYAAIDAADWPVRDPLGAEGGEMSDTAAAVFFALIFLTYALYITLTMASRRMATPGMRAVGIIATDIRGERVSFVRAVARFFAVFLSSYALGIGFLLMPFTKRRQMLHDLIAGTVILKAPSSGG